MDQRLHKKTAQSVLLQAGIETEDEPQTTTGDQLRAEAIAEKLPHALIQGYDVYFEGNDKEGWSSFSPTLLGCVSAGGTLTECKRSMGEAIELHLSAMADDGDSIPPRDWRGRPRPAARRGRTINISPRVSPETAKILDQISEARGISKTEAIELAVAYYGKKVIRIT